jgi:hypothetical protein
MVSCFNDDDGYDAYDGHVVVDGDVWSANCDKFPWMIFDR